MYISIDQHKVGNISSVYIRYMHVYAGYVITVAVLVDNQVASQLHEVGKRIITVYYQIITIW